MRDLFRGVNVVLLIVSVILFFACGGGGQTGSIENVKLRSESAELSLDELMQMVKDKGLACPGDGIKGKLKHSYEPGELRGVKVVNDHATGLTWMQAVHEERMDWKEAEAYVAKANEEQLAGISDWRMPTVEELLSLMESQKKNDYFIASVFHEELLAPWTSDVVKDAFAGAWFVDFVEGKAVDGNRAAGLGHVRLVRTME